MSPLRPMRIAAIITVALSNITVSLYSQTPLVKMEAYENDSVYQVRNNKKKKAYYPSVLESRIARVERRIGTLQARQNAIQDSCRIPTLSEATYSRLEAENQTLEKKIKSKQDSIKPSKDTIHDYLVNSYVEYLKGPRTWGAIFLPASPFARDTSAKHDPTSALYLNPRYKGIRAVAFYKFIYGSESNWGALNNVSIQAQGKQTSLYAEIGSGIVGPVRFG